MSSLCMYIESNVRLESNSSYVYTYLTIKGDSDIKSTTFKDASLPQSFRLPVLTYFKCLPQERRRRAAKLRAPPPCGPLSSPRNPKKLWSQWLRRKVGTKARNRVARRIKIPKRRVSAVGSGCSKIAHSKWLMYHHFNSTPDLISYSDVFQLLNLSKRIKARPRLLGRRWLRMVTRAWLLTRSCRRRERSSFASAQCCLLKNQGEINECQTRYS